MTWYYAQLCLENDIYPGGICWIKGNRPDVGQQIITFASEKLELTFANELSHRERLEQCWRQWRQEDTLVLITDARDYQSISDCIPPTDRQFKTIVTTRQLHLQTWSAPAFTLLSLQPLTYEESELDTNQERGKHFSWLLGIGVCLLSINTVSLLAAYILADSPPWIKEFTYNGHVTEFLRSCILYFLFSLVCSYFRSEAMELYSLSPSRPSMSRILSTRLSLTIGYIICIGLLIQYHLQIAPSVLAEAWGGDPPLNSEAGYALYKLPYLYYLPYSFINFIVVGISTVIISIYAIYKDVIKLSKVKKYFNQELQKVRTFIRRESGTALFKNVYIHKVEREFERFSQKLSDTLDRYTFLFLVCTVGLAFEVLYGKNTLAEIALDWITGAYFFLFVVAGGIFLSYSYHEGGLSQCVRLLLSLDYEGIERFQTRRSSIRFLQKRVFSSIYVFLSILTIFATFVAYLVMKALAN